MWFFYFADVCENVGFWGMLVTGILFLAVGIMSLIYVCDGDAHRILSQRGFKPGKLLWGLGLIMFLFTFIPSKKTVYLMAGTQVVENFLDNSEEICKLPNNTAKLLNNCIDELNAMLDENDVINTTNTTNN